MQTKVLTNSAELINAAASDFSQLANRLLRQKPRVQVLLTGGSLGIEFVRALGKANLDFKRFDFMFSDERFVGMSDPDRNEFQGMNAWPDLVNFLRRYPGPELSLGDARDILENQYRGFLDQNPVVDLAVLGLGPDAHIASLFPGHDGFGDLIIAEDDSPKPPAKRLSLSFKALNMADRVWFLASGAGKGWAVSEGMKSTGNVPAARVRGRLETVWYLDQELSDAL